MSIYLNPILSACYIFPVLAAVFTLPYIIYQYRKYGSILILRALIIYTFIFYMMTSYFMTILPLPAIDSVTANTASYLLVPFDALRNMVSTSGFDLSDLSTYPNLLTNSYFYQILFNILLLFPFGVYLHYYFNRKWYQVFFLSFLYSLFFELTQATGLYGIYPYPYRYFEVDDLICNTLGGMIGFWLTPALLFFLPDRERLDKMSYEKGAHISVFRRLLAFTMDQAVLFLIYIVFTILIQHVDSLETFLEKQQLFYIPLISFLVMVLIMSITSGSSLGKWIVKIKVVREDGTKPQFLQILARNALLYLFILPLNFYVLLLYDKSNQQTNQTIEFFLFCLLSIIIAIEVVIGLNMLKQIAHKKSQYCYDRLLHLTTISTIHNKHTHNIETEQENDRPKHKHKANHNASHKSSPNTNHNTSHNASHNTSHSASHNTNHNGTHSGNHNMNYNVNPNGNHNGNHKQKNEPTENTKSAQQQTSEQDQTSEQE